MQHLNWRFKHLHELHHTLVGTAQRAGIAIGIRIVLRVVFQFTDIDLTDQRGDILVVLIARLGLGNRNLLQNGRPDFYHAEFGDVAAKLMQALRRPRRHDRAEIAVRDAKLFVQNLGIFLRIEQAERMIINRAAFSVGAKNIDRHALHH